MLLNGKRLKIFHRIFSYNKNENIIFALWTAVTFFLPDKKANSNAYCAIFSEADFVIIFMLSITPGNT